MASSTQVAVGESTSVMCVGCLNDCDKAVHAPSSVAPAPPSDGPVQLLCPRCQQVVLSKVDYTAGLLTYLFCGGLFLCGCVLGCCLIPFCVNRLKNAKHSCPTCKSPLGVYKRL
uniref:LITAF domain-containing protein n=1 Tax=Periophthalmus magnuspinnatus TaxID=409849 RepID=A0A3B4AB65_9GOBI